jgi:streptogramin lyase
MSIPVRAHRAILFALFLIGSLLASAATVEFPLPANATRQPYPIAKGPDGNIWFGFLDGSGIGRITPDGTLTDYGTPNRVTALTAGPDSTLWFLMETLRVGRLTVDGFDGEFAFSAACTSGTDDITTGPDGNLWFVRSCDDHIFRMTPGGAVVSFPVSAGSGPWKIVSGPDGNLWASLHYGDKIARITTAGVVTEFNVGNGVYTDGITTGSDGNLWFQSSGLWRITPAGAMTPFYCCYAFDITSGPDGKLWTAGGQGNFVSQVSTSGSVLLHPATSDESRHIVAGSDNRMWFNTDQTIGAVDMSGVVQEYPAMLKRPVPGAMTKASDGTVWFVETQANRIGRITTNGAITEFPIPTPSSGPFSIVAASDGALWFTESNADNIGRITTAGAITEYPVATANGRPSGLTVGPDGNLWYTLKNANRIGRMTLAGNAIDYAAGGTSLQLDKIIAGPDGNLWSFGAGTTIYKTTTAGVTTTGSAFPIQGTILAVVAGPDGNAWISASDGVAKVSSAGVVTKYNLNYGLANLAVGSDGAIWGGGFDTIVRITTSGDAQPYAVPYRKSSVTGITGGGDGNLWFGESSGRIARFQLESGIIATGAPICLESTHYANAVASFTSATLRNSEDYQATIEWGDGTTTPGVITFFGGTYGVMGDHTYARLDSYVIHTTITASDATATAQSETKFARLDVPTGSVCPRRAFTARAVTSPSASGFTWSIQNGVIVSGQGTANIIFKASSAGVVHLSLSVSDSGCSRTVTADVAAANCIGNGDANGDGKSDIIWRNSDTGATSIWLMDGASPREGSGLTSLQFSNNTFALAGTGDFNADGREDLVWHSSDQTFVWTMNGTTADADSGPAPSYWNAWTLAGVGDFDGDGNSDFFWRSGSTNEIWFMDHRNFRSSLRLGDVGGNWHIAGIGDFNNDGRSDILWRNDVDGASSIWMLYDRGVESDSGATNLQIGPSWRVGGTGDFNGDGYSDVLWRNTITGQNIIWLQHGTVTIAGSGTTNPVPDTTWGVAGIGDFNADGRSDILWRNPQTGATSIWMMDGITVGAGSGILGNIPPPWQIVGPKP